VRKTIPLGELEQTEQREAVHLFAAGYLHIGKMREQLDLQQPPREHQAGPTPQVLLKPDRKERCP
jgi:hypothetical protein